MTNAVTIIGDAKVIWGVPDKPLSLDVPKGCKVRFRFRNSDWARAFIRDGASTRHFILGEQNGKWVLLYEQGANWRKSSLTYPTPEDIYATTNSTP